MEVYFWDGFASVTELVLACEKGLYPPRSILDVDGRRGISASCIEVEFTGITTPFVVEILLSIGLCGVNNIIFPCRVHNIICYGHHTVLHFVAPIIVLAIGYRLYPPITNTRRCISVTKIFHISR